MDNLNAVYQILAQLERDIDKPGPDLGRIDAQALCVSERRWLRYIEQLSKAGYIEGAHITQTVCGDCNYNCRDMQITLEGLTYLQENPIMQKARRAAAGFKDVTPGL